MILAIQSHMTVDVGVGVDVDVGAGVDVGEARRYLKTI